MKQFLGSLLVGVLVGLAVGLFIGWEQYPVEYTNSSLEALDPYYKQQYTIMVAEGYQVDHDINTALNRLQVLGEDNLFEYVRDLTQQFISQSNVPAIPPMVALAEALGIDLGPVMDIYRVTPVPSPTPAVSQ
ncbi:MAG: hypothetical protein JW966_08980 [Anaerolineae bacterium]|nr:hypothetical protein [Anaerolineae bacterium]